MIKKVIHELKSGKGIIKTDQKEILTELVDYNKQLYSGSNCTKSQISDLDEYVMKAKLSKLTENQKLVCDAPITLEECKNALNQLHTNKSPGMDGFTIEFYKAFWNDIKNCLFDSIAFSFNISISRSYYIDSETRQGPFTCMQLQTYHFIKL